VGSRIKPGPQLAGMVAVVTSSSSKANRQRRNAPIEEVVIVAGIAVAWCYGGGSEGHCR
jgi:hypothetical protein